MKTIGFITSSEDPELTLDDLLSRGPLASRGFQLKPVVWDGIQPDWSQFHALVFRSCWNYHRKFDEFVKWASQLKSLQIPTFNSIDISIWNLHKKYLLELGEKGIVIPSSRLILRGSTDFAQALAPFHGDAIVIKPAVSLNGHDTFLMQRTDEDQAFSVLRNQCRTRDILIQEFLPAVRTSGELSLVFLGGQFSHAVRKIPKQGEFRVQAEYGGTRQPCSPSKRLIEQAQSILRAASCETLFARVDGVEQDGRLILMELEIVDPMLYLGYSDGAPERFAGALAASV